MLRMRRAGSLPEPVPGTRKYDFEAVKRGLDRLGDPKAQSSSDEDELIARAKAWGRGAAEKKRG